MMELQLFNNKEFGEIRALKIKGQPWFVGKDAAKALGYENQNRDIVTHVDVEDRMMLGKTQYENGIEFDYKKLGQRGGWIINESGLYSLILYSQLPNAKKFKRWVTSEVLPQIRQTGGYIPFSQGESDEEFLARALIVAQKTLDKKNKMIEEMQPKANYFDRFMNSEGYYSSTQVAKLYKISSAKKLNKLLNDKGLIYRQGDNWMPYASVDKSWFKVIVGQRNGHNYSQLKFTPRGIYEISKILEIEITEEDLQELI